MAALDRDVPPAQWDRRDWLAAAALFLATAISRIPFRTTLYYAWDSVLYAKALDRFDVTIFQPQPPGHILYVYLVKIVNQVVGDPNAAMIWVSIVASAAAVVTLYRLGMVMYGRTTGLLAAIFLASSLSYWGHGEVALPYTLLSFLSALSALLIYGAWQGKSSHVLYSSLCLGIASGLRQDLLLFLLPLWLTGLLGKRWRLGALSASLLAATVAAWYIPSALLSGGFSSYQHASSAQSDYLLRTASIFGRGLDGLLFNLHALGKFSLYALAAATPFLLYYLARLFIGGGARARRDKRLLFLGVWIVPSLLFYIFIHVGEYGYVFSFLPAALLMAGMGLEIASGDLARISRIPFDGRILLLALAFTALAVNLALFLVLNPHLSADRLAANDRIQRSRIEAIREHFDPKTTLVISSYNYQQAEYYLPQYKHWYIDPVTADMPVMQLSPDIKNVVLFEESLQAGDEEEARALPLVLDQHLDYFVASDKRLVIVDWQNGTVRLEATDSTGP